MKNTDITKIRQTLKKSENLFLGLIQERQTLDVDCPTTFSHTTLQQITRHCKAITAALALLPCETCGGTGIKHCKPMGGNTVVHKGFDMPCPNC